MLMEMNVAGHRSILLLKILTDSRITIDDSLIYKFRESINYYEIHNLKYHK